MKISSIEVFAFKYDHHYRLGGHSDAPNRIPGTDYYFEPQWKHAYSRLTESCLVKVTTQDGIVGWGEGQAPLIPEVPATLIARLFGPAILGMDATRPADVYDRLYHLNHVRGHTASYTIDAIAAIDIALWDIRAQAAIKPLNHILGRVRNHRLPLYVSGLRRPEQDQRRALATELMEEGYRGVKIFFGGTPERTIDECEAIRAAIGPDRELAFDAICRHEYEDAFVIGSALDALKASWYESPLDPEDVASHARLTQAIQTPVAVGEPLRTIREFQPWLSQRAMRIAQPDIMRCGITGGLRIFDQALECGLRVAPHIGVCTSIGIAATWHMASILNDALSQEHQLDMFDTSNKVLAEPLRVEGGNAVVPAGIGLGVHVDESFVRAHSSDTWLVK